MTADEIFTTTTLRRPEAEKIAAALIDAPPFVVGAFRAMLQTGIYTTDEMVERITALRIMAR